MKRNHDLHRNRDRNNSGRRRERWPGSVDLARLAFAAVAILLAPATVPAATDTIPHGTVALAAEGSVGISAAWLAAPTDRYPHGVLGDLIEGGTLAVIDDTGIEQRVVLPVDRVFEDLTPRIADVTGNGRNDVVVVESQAETGASLAVYSMNGDKLSKIAATPHIGLPSRWLAPAGIADFDDDGVADVAYVETPHLGGTLRFWSFRGGRERLLASAPGFSNHRIGEPFISGGLRDCGAGPELVLPDFAWRRTLTVRVTYGAVESSVYAADTSAETLARALNCK